MKIDAQGIRALREARHWSQDQLADACGLNLRTIQRVEREGRASNESLRALAAVFEVTPDSLRAAPGVSASPRSARSVIWTELLRFDDFAGRSNRFEYGWFLLACVIVLAIGTLLHPIVHGVLALVLLVPLLASGTRRLRDGGESPWWQLFWLVPFGFLIVLWLQSRPTLEGPPSGAYADG